MDDSIMSGAELEVFAEKEWSLISDEEKKAYDNDFNFFYSDLWFCLCT
jgi:hypothetical protein